MSTPEITSNANDALPESRFGFWFLGTKTWETFVVRAAIEDLCRLIPEGRWPSRPVVLDAGCGQGKSFQPLYERFAPERIVGIDVEPRCIAHSTRVAEMLRGALPVEVRRGDASALHLPDASVDLVFCHQAFHHLSRQEAALTEFYRVLRPGGLLLFAESTRAFIGFWLTRLLFSNPMDVQHTAEEYISMLRAHGFEFGPENVSYPYLWWSRADLGVRGRLGFGVPPHGEREETLINIVAIKLIPRQQVSSAGDR